MKKLAFLFMALAALLFVTVGCKGDDGDNGESATDLILKETGNIWYKYNPKSSTGNTDVSGTTSDSSSVNLADVYIKYDTASKCFVVAACGDSYYAQSEKELGASKWAASAVTLRILGRIEKQSSDPIGQKTRLSDVNWGSFTMEALITDLFDGE